jgi:hypothetical protein
MADDRIGTHDDLVEILRESDFVSKEPNEPEPPDRPRRRKRMDPEIAALKKVAVAIEAMDYSSRRACICWLADKYLGLKFWRSH